MRQNKYLLVTIPVIIILLLFGMIFYSRYKNNPRFWYCNPSEPRRGDLQTWEKTINPELPVSQVDEEFFGQFTISSDQEKFTIDFPNKKPNENPFAFELHELSPGENINIGSGTLEFTIIGTIYPDANQSKEKRAEFCFYDSHLQPLSEEQVIQLENNGIIQSRYDYSSIPFPNVNIIFQYQGIERLILNNIKVFDSRTKNLLSSGHSSSRGEKSWWFDVNIPLWHNTPVDVVIDASFGPTQTFEFPPVAGQGFSTGDFECRLLDVFEGVHASMISSRALRKVSAEEACQRFYFICQPQAQYMPVTFELFDKEGNKITTRGGSTSAYTHIFGLMEPLEKVALVCAHYRPKRYRIVIHLPFIPGLPEQNKDIDNLFEVHIPYANFQDAFNIGQFLKKTLQINNLQSIGPIPANSVDNVQFPVSFIDVTVRDIAKLYSTGGTLNVDIENDQLTRKYPIPLSTRLKQYWDKIFRK